MKYRTISNADDETTTDWKIFKVMCIALMHFGGKFYKGCDKVVCTTFKA